MSREVHVPFCERLGVQFPRPTHRFCLSFRDAEDLLVQRGVTVTYETIRQWCQRFGPVYARRLRRRRGRLVTLGAGFRSLSGLAWLPPKWDTHASSTRGPARHSATGRRRVYSRRLLHRPVESARQGKKNRVHGLIPIVPAPRSR